MLNINLNKGGALVDGGIFKMLIILKKQELKDTKRKKLKTNYIRKTTENKQNVKIYMLKNNNCRKGGAYILF